jgi:hypothetical protein
LKATKEHKKAPGKPGAFFWPNHLFGVARPAAYGGPCSPSEKGWRIAIKKPDIVFNFINLCYH